MATKLKDTTRNTMMTAINTAITSTSRLFIYSGSEPAKTNSPTGTSGITNGIPLNATPGTVSNGQLVINTTGMTGTAAAAIVPQYYRIVDGTTDDGNHTQIQGSCSVGAGGDIQFSSQFAIGGTVTITQLQYTDGNA